MNMRKELSIAMRLGQSACAKKIPDGMSASSRSQFLKRLPENITFLNVSAAHGLNLDSFNGSLYLCPFHTDKRPSLQLNKPDSRDGWFYCHGCKATGDMIHWISYRYGISRVAAYLQLRTEHGLGRDECLGSRPDLGPVYIGGLRDFTDQELERLCASRAFSFEALKTQLCPSILKYVPHYSRHSAYAVCDPLRRIAVLRRMDGQPWIDDQKARNAPGSNTKIPIGVHAIASFASVMLCEGGPDYLRLVSLLHECDFSIDILPLMMPSVTPMIDPRVVGCFKDKRVRICAQNDEPGIAAARKWQDQLEMVGAITDIWIPPRIQLSDGGFTKDLDDLFWKLNPDIRGEQHEVHTLINLNIRLFPACELSIQG
jgi:CHC2-type zinc finger protein